MLLLFGVEADASSTAHKFYSWCCSSWLIQKKIYVTTYFIFICCKTWSTIGST